MLGQGGKTMTLEERIEQMKIMLGEDGDDIENNVCKTYLDLANQTILNHRYPFGTDKVEIEPQFEYALIELAIVKYNMRGVEGQETHNENGVHRKYRKESEILASIPKFAGLPL